MMRNLHMVDDANGALNLIRGETAGSTTLTKAGSILKGRILIRNSLAVSLVNMQCQNFGNNSHNDLLRRRSTCRSRTLHTAVHIVRIRS